MYFNQLSKHFRDFLGIIQLGSYFFKEKKKKSLSTFLRKLGCNCYIGFQLISFSCRSKWCPNNTSNAQRNWELVNPLLPAVTGLVKGLNMCKEPEANEVRGQNSGCWSCKCFFFAGAPMALLPSETRTQCSKEKKSSKEAEVDSGPEPERKTS